MSHIKIIPLKHITQEYIDNLNDSQVNRFISTRNTRQTLKMVKKYTRENHLYGIYEKDKLIGTIGFSSVQIVAILIFKNYQRKGYGLMALDKVKKDKMMAGIDDKNTASIRLFEKAGFKVRKMWQYKKRKGK